MNKETITTELTINFETGDINVRKATIYTDEGEEITRKLSNNRYAPWLDGRKEALQEALSDHPKERDFIINELWTKEFIDAKKAEHDALENESKGR